jgi:hypothetical protein
MALCRSPARSCGWVVKIEKDGEGTRGQRRKSAARRTSEGIYRARDGLIINEDVEHTGVVSTVQKRGRGRR